MTLITTTGTAERHILAERATIVARISEASNDRATSISSATALHDRLATAAAALRKSGAATWHLAGALSTSPRTWTDKNGAKHSDHVTSGTVRVKLQDLAVVADTVAAFSAVGATASVEWTLTEATKREAIRAARASAVKDAAARAADFAAGLGKTIAQTVAIREEHSGGYSSGTRGGSSASDHAALSVEEITVSVNVTGDFETV